MIHHVKGDLLVSDCNFIAHQSNCLGGFGSGIAGQIRKKVPEMFQVFAGDTRKPKEKLGNFTYTRTKFGWGFNLYGQFYYGGNDPKGFDTDYDAFRKALDRMLTIVPELCRISGIKCKPAEGEKNFISKVKIGLPYLIGCGLAGGDWNVVYNIIEELSKKHSIDIWLYEFTP